MSLIDCPSCGKKISDTSLKCISCGHPLRNEVGDQRGGRKRNVQKKKFAIIGFFIIVICATYLIINPSILDKSQIPIKSISNKGPQLLNGVLRPDNVVNKRCFDSNSNFMGYVDENGQWTGDWKEFYPDGTVAIEGSYLKGLMNGEFIFYDSDGVTRHVGEFQYGNRNVSNSMGYLTDGRVGEHVFYHANGVLAGKGFYTEKLKNKHAVYWHENGVKAFEIKFHSYYKYEYPCKKDYKKCALFSVFIWDETGLFLEEKIGQYREYLYSHAISVNGFFEY